MLVSDASALQKWRDGDKTVPLVEIVDSFDVFHTGQGAQGLLGRASKQHLDSVFGTSKVRPALLLSSRFSGSMATTLDRTSIV